MRDPQWSMAAFVEPIRCLLWLCVLGVSTPAVVVAEQIQNIPASAVIRFAGTSTLHGFGGELATQPFFLILSNGTWSASGQVLSGQMLTDNEKRDRKMHDMMNTNNHPTIHGSVSNAPIPGPAGTNATIGLKIRGTSQDLAVRISDWQETSEAIRFRARWELSLKQYGLKPPSVIGVVRVGDIVRLEADVVAKKATPSAPHPPQPSTP